MTRVSPVAVNRLGGTACSLLCGDSDQSSSLQGACAERGGFRCRPPLSSIASRDSKRLPARAGRDRAIRGVPGRLLPFPGYPCRWRRAARGDCLRLTTWVSRRPNRGQTGRASPGASSAGPREIVLCVALEGPAWNHVEEVHDLPVHVREEIEQFVTGRSAADPAAEVVAWWSRDAALSAIDDAAARWAATVDGHG
jgi:hypothetical protein